MRYVLGYFHLGYLHYLQTAVADIWSFSSPLEWITSLTTFRDASELFLSDTNLCQNQSESALFIYLKVRW